MRKHVLLLTFIGIFSSHAAVINWTNSSGGYWNTAVKWSPNQVPSTNDIAVVTNSGTYAVRLNVDPTLAGLIVGGGTGIQEVVTAGQTLTLNGSGLIETNGLLTFYGTLTGSNLVTVAGTIAWLGGPIETQAVLTVTTSGQLVIGGGANHARVLRGSVTNSGSVLYQPPGPLQVAGRLHNRTNGLVDIQWDNALFKGGPDGVVINEGIIRKSVGPATSGCEVPLLNYGTVDTQTGKVVLSDGSKFYDGCRFTGVGQTLLNSGTNVLYGRVYSENLFLGDASLTGTGTLSGTLNWMAGYIDYGAALLLSTNSQLIVGGGANFVRVLRGSLTNAGTILYQAPGPLQMVGLLHNLPGGLVDIQWDNALFKGGPEALVVNEGTFRKSAGGGTSGCEVPLLNYGTVDTQTGKVVLSDGSKFYDGCRFTGVGQTLLNSGTNVLYGRVYSENLFLGDASLTGTGTLSGTLNWMAGYIDYGAALLLSTNSQLIVGGGANFVRVLRGSLTNAGTILYQAPGPLQMVGLLHNLPDGLVDIQWDNALFKGGPDSVVINEGTFRKSAGGGTSGCEVPLLNFGTVDTQIGKVVLSDGSEFHDGCRFTGAGQTWLSTGTNTLYGRIYSENVYLGDASLTGTGTIIGTLRWMSGYLDYGAEILLAANSQLVIGGGANYTRVLLGSLTNAGTVLYQEPGPFVMVGSLHNLPGGLVDIQWNNALFKGGPEARVVNEGILRKSAGGGTSVCEVPLLNYDTVDAQIGNVALSDGSKFYDGCRFIGAGQTWLNAGTNTLCGKVYAENVYLGDAFLAGTGTVSGKLMWMSGYIDYGAAVLLDTNSQLIVGGGANFARVLRGGLTNAGTILYQPPGPLVMAGQLHNLPGGLVDFQWDNALYKGGSAALVVNEGIVRKSVGGGASGCEVPFYNRGVVEVPSGTVYFIGPYVDQSGILALAGGGVRVDNPLYLASGRLTGWGTVVGDVINQAGIVSPANSNGVVTIYGNYTQQLGGYLELLLAGDNPGVNQSRLNVTQGARLSGTISIRWATSYVPSPGDVFPVMSFAARAGDFVGHNGFILLGHNRRLTTEYTPTLLKLVAVEAPDPEKIPLLIGAQGNTALVSWPTEFAGASLYCCTNLAESRWILVPGVTNNRFLDSPMVPQKYFLLSEP